MDMKRVNEIEQKLVFTDSKWKFAQIVRPGEIKELITMLNNANEQKLSEGYEIAESLSIQVSGLQEGIEASLRAFDHQDRLEGIAILKSLLEEE